MTTISLRKFIVELPGNENYGERWTLSPWYEETDFADLSILHYYEPAPEHAELDDNELMPYIHHWAETALRETTDYLIHGWASATTPLLTIRVHRLEIYTTGHTHVVSVPGWRAYECLRCIGHPDVTLKFVSDTNLSNGNRLVSELVIPTSNIITINHTIEYVQIS